MLTIGIILPMSEVVTGTRDLTSLSCSAVAKHLSRNVVGFESTGLTYRLNEESFGLDLGEVYVVRGAISEDDLAIAILTGSIDRDRLEIVNVVRVQLDA